MIRRPPRSTQGVSSAASDVYKRQGLYISAGYWFTSSTSFANPAVTLARGFTNTFTGIDPQFIIAFIVFQVFGAIMAMVFMKYLQED